MTLYTLVSEENEKTNNKVTTNVISIFDRTPIDKTSEVAEVSSISSIYTEIGLMAIIGGKTQVNLAFETEKEAQHYADILNKRIKGRRSRFIESLYGCIEGPSSFSPRLVSDETEQRFRAAVQSGEFDFNYKLINTAINSQKWAIRFLVITACIVSAYIPIVFFRDFFAEKYHNTVSWYLENRGSAYIRIYDSEGMDIMSFTNNTVDNPNLTQIPQIPLRQLDPDYSSIDSSACKEYPFELQLTFSGLKSGHYVFNVKLRDCKGNIEDKIYDFDIDNSFGRAGDTSTNR